MEKLKKFLIPAYIIWSVISMLQVGLYIVVNYCFEKPLTKGFEYFKNIQVDKEISDGIVYTDDKPIFEVNIVKSDTTGELLMAEVVITTYTDYEKQSYKRFGMQLVGSEVYYWRPSGRLEGRYSSSSLFCHSSGLKTQSFGSMQYAMNGYGVYFYEVDVDGQVSSIQSRESFDKELDNLFLTAGKEMFSVQLGGEQAKYSYRVDYWNWLKHHKYDKEVEYCSNDLFYELYSRFNAGYDDGEYSFKHLNLDKFFTIKKMNSNNQFYSLSEVDDNSAYFSIKLNYKTVTTGLKASDSVMGIVKGDVNFDAGISNEKKSSYSQTVELELNAMNLKTIYNKDLNKCVVGLSNSFNAYLQTLNNLEVTVVVDTADYDKVVSGIDISTFKNLNVTKITIKSDSATDFIVVGSHKTISSATFDTTLNLITAKGAKYE